MSWKTFIGLAMLIVAVGLVAQDQVHQIGQAKTLTLVTTAYRPDGSVNHTSYVREAVREDGSWARDMVVVETATGERTHTAEVRDFETGRKTAIYYDLGVRTVTELDPSQVHAYHLAMDDCLRRVEGAGPQVGDDPLTRRKTEGAKEAQVTFDPDLGCNVTETVSTQDGRLVSERRIVSTKLSADQSLFNPDMEGLKAVTRVQLLARYEEVHGRPMLGGGQATLERVAELDRQQPFLLED